MRALRHRYGRAGGPEAAFKASVRKIERMIAACEAGETEGSSDDTKVFKALNRLEDRIYQNWHASADDAQRASQEETAKALRTRMRAAVDTGFHARQARRSREIQAITEREREARAEHMARDPAGYQYEQELKRLRGGK